MEESPINLHLGHSPAPLALSVVKAEADGPAAKLGDQNGNCPLALRGDVGKGHPERKRRASNDSVDVSIKYRSRTFLVQKRPVCRNLRQMLLSKRMCALGDVPDWQLPSRRKKNISLTQFIYTRSYRC